mgnify:CR=1 FL=1
MITPFNPYVKYKGGFMRKIVLNTLLFVLVLFLSGCNFEKKEEEKIINYAKLIDKIVDSAEVKTPVGGWR